jgi:hypothetical protein
VQTQKTEEATTEELRTGLHGGIDRAERAEDEVKRLETLTRRMRNSIDRSIAELYNIPEARTAIRLLERTYAESSDPCLNCDIKRIVTSLGQEMADLYSALGQAVTFAHGCPPYGQKAQICKLMKNPPGSCAECWATHLIETAREKREQATGYVNPLAIENERLRAELSELKALAGRAIAPKYSEGEADE